jgi:choline dehydrogenase-like flavoprotein
MIYIRGNRRDFDGWAKLGNRGWSYEEVLPYFKKSETYHGPLSPYHGDNGPLSIIDLQTPRHRHTPSSKRQHSLAPSGHTTTLTAHRRRPAPASISQRAVSMPCV